MKHLFFLPLLIITVYSCSSDNDTINQEKFQEDIQRWQLAKMTGSVADETPRTGNNMEWQEYYQLNADNTFIKNRERDGRKIEISGTYEFITRQDGTYLELSYDSDNDIIGNCTADTKEFLQLRSENELIGTWWACDGPGLFYERIK